MKKEVMEFLGDVNQPVAFATTEGGQARVRFFFFKMEHEGALYFLTSKQKNVFKEMSGNPQVEVCSLPNAEKSWIRIAAKVEFIENVTLNRKAFSLLPLLEKAYGNPENKDVVLLKLVDMDIRKFSLDGTVEKLSF